MNNQVKQMKNRYFPGKNPCDSCAHGVSCDAVCWHRAKWWDVQMVRLRAKMEEKNHGLEA